MGLFSRYFFLVAIVLLTSLSGFANELYVSKNGEKNKPLIVGYYNQWGIYSPNVHTRHLPLELFTHLVYRSAHVSTHNEVVPGDLFADIGHLYPDVDVDRQEFVGSFGELVRLKKEYSHLKTIISIGGWDRSDVFASIASSPESRQKFSSSAVVFMQRYGFDGIEIDWQIPIFDPSIKDNPVAQYHQDLILLLKSLREALDQQGTRYLLTTTFSPWWVAVDWPMAKAAQSVDFISLHTGYINGYWSQRAGHLSPMYTASRKQDSVDSLVGRVLSKGVPSNKVVINVVPFATGWQGFDSAATGLNKVPKKPSWGSWDNHERGATGLYSRSYLQHLLNEDGYQQRWDDTALVPYLYNAERFGGHFISFENDRSLAIKADYIIDRQLAGFGIREIHNDVHSEWPFIHKIYSEFYPWQAAVLKWERFYQTNRVMLTTIGQMLIILGFLGLIWLSWARRQGQRLAREQQIYQTVRDNLQALEVPLLQLLQMSPECIENAKRLRSKKLGAVSEAAVSLLKPVSQLLTETKLSHSQRAVRAEQTPARYVLGSLAHTLSINYSGRVDFDQDDVQNSILVTDPLYLIQLLYDIAFVLLDSTEASSKVILSARLADQQTCHFVVSCSNVNDQLPLQEYYKLKEIYRNAQRINVPLKQYDSEKGCFELFVPVSEQQLKTESLIWLPGNVTPNQANDDNVNQHKINKDDIAQNGDRSLAIHQNDTSSSGDSDDVTQTDSVGTDAEKLYAPAPELDASAALAQTAAVDPREISRSHWQHLQTFSNYEFSSRDAGKLVEQACEFFSVNIEQDLKLSIYQGEQLVSTLGVTDFSGESSLNVLSGEFRFVIESEQALNRDDKQFFELLIGQVQMVRRALKGLAKEPATLSELSVLATQKDKISYLKADAGYTAIFLVGQKDARYISMRLRNIKQYFDDDALQQIHRSYLVNPRRVEEVMQTGKMKFEMLIDGERLPVSRTYISILREQHPAWFKRSF